MNVTVYHSFNGTCSEKIVSTYISLLKVLLKLFKYLDKEIIPATRQLCEQGVVLDHI